MEDNKLNMERNAVKMECDHLGTQNNKLSYLKEVNIYKLSEAAIFALVLQDGRIGFMTVSGRIMICNTQIFKVELQFQAHKKLISHYGQLENGKIVTMAEGKKIKIWQLINDNPTEKYKLDKELKFPSKNQKFIVLSKNRIAVYSIGKLDIWDLNSSFNIVHQINVEPEISLFQLTKKDAMVVCHQNELDIINLSTYQKEYTVKNVVDSDEYSYLEVGNDKLICGGMKKILIINLEKKEVEQECNVQDDNICGFTFFMNLKCEYYLCSSLGNIHLYNMKTNTFEIGNYPGKFLIFLCRLNESRYIWFSEEEVHVFEITI